MPTVDQLRAELLEQTLQQLVEYLSPLKAGLDLQDLEALGIDEAFLIDFADRYEHAPNNADTGEYLLSALPPHAPDGTWLDEDTEPIGVHNRPRSGSGVRRR
jgi:hypothetical protein